MMVERYPNLKEEVGGSIPGCEVSSLRDIKTCQAVNYLLYFGIDLPTFYLKSFFSSQVTLHVKFYLVRVDWRAIFS
jgi:hypothetical protein